MTARIRRFALAALTLALVALTAPRAGTQQTGSTAVAAPAADTAAPRAAAAPGPTVDRGAVGVRNLARRPALDEQTQSALEQRLGLGKARALMIVGFATVIVGLLIGDDVGTLIAIAGAAVGLYGLYNYLK
jgi:hypothetical protein